jgi:hypothetical protein
VTIASLKAKTASEYPAATGTVTGELNGVPLMPETVQISATTLQSASAANTLSDALVSGPVAVAVNVWPTGLYAPGE